MRKLLIITKKKSEIPEPTRHYNERNKSPRIRMKRFRFLATFNLTNKQNLR